MSEDSMARATDRPVPRDRPDQQAAKNDPLDIETMVRHARQAAHRSQAAASPLTTA
ncbi:hypothetical protein [Streptomyces sp. NPDC060027]|uniref:hypothetical protein n=1 Tax=Streptomyces sp. NPDC060027 TaxID=3347040 RepID=UPI0036B1D125